MSATDAQILQVLPLTDALACQYGHKLVDPAHDRDDLRQAAAVGVVKAANDWRPDPRGFAGWAWRKAHGEAMHLVRDQTPGGRTGRPLQTVSLDTPVSEGSDLTIGDTLRAPDLVEDVDLRLTLEAALKRLDPWDRALLTLSVVEGVPQREIGAQLGMTRVQMSWRTRRATRRLAETPEVEALRSSRSHRPAAPTTGARGNLGSSES